MCNRASLDRCKIRFSCFRGDIWSTHQLERVSIKAKVRFSMKQGRLGVGRSYVMNERYCIL